MGNYKPFYFEVDISPLDIEISEDMYIITGEEAEKHKEPRELSSLEINPNQIMMIAGSTNRFTIKGFDQHNKEMPLDNVAWSATGGHIDADGLYRAGKAVGAYEIIGEVNNLSSKAVIIIYEKGEKPPPPPTLQKIIWEGEIPPQKWMNFYTKVLSKFSMEQTLKIILNFEVTPERRITQNEIEELKSILRELGLNDNIKVEKE